MPAARRMAGTYTSCCWAPASAAANGAAPVACGRCGAQNGAAARACAACAGPLRLGEADAAAALARRKDLEERAEVLRVRRDADVARLVEAVLAAEERRREAVHLDRLDLAVVEAHARVGELDTAGRGRLAVGGVFVFFLFLLFFRRAAPTGAFQLEILSN